MAPVKTGAARIALGAHGAGCEGLAIVPVGIHYENKAALRSRVFVNVGDPIDVDAFVAARTDPTDGSAGSVIGSDDHDAVRDLNDDITVALRRAAPDYDDWTEEHLLTHAAEVTVRSLADEPSHRIDGALRDRLANTLADRPADDRAAICEAAARYRDDLDAVGYTDAELVGRIGNGRLALGVLLHVLLAIVTLPFAVVGAVINVVPFLIVRLIGSRPLSPSLMATVKPLAAAGAFGLAWAVVMWWAWRVVGWTGPLIALVLLPIYLAAVVAFVDRVTVMWRLLRRRRARRPGDTLAESVVDDRLAVIEAVAS